MRATAISMALSARDFTVPLRCTTLALVDTSTLVSLSAGSLAIAAFTLSVMTASVSVQAAVPSSNMTASNAVVRLSSSMGFSFGP